MKLPFDPYRCTGPAMAGLGLALAALNLTNGTVLPLCLVISANGVVHTVQQSDTRSLGLDSGIVAHLAARPDGASLPEIAQVVGARPVEAAKCLLRLRRKGLVTVADESTPIADRLFRLAA